MYYDDEGDDPYVPHIGPAAMPSPRSKFAPYFSGCADSLEDFLEEYEGLAYGCALTDPQRVDVLIRYVAPLLRDFWRSLNGYRSHNWPLFRQSLVTIFGNPTPRHQIMRQKLHSHVQDSSRRRMDFHAGHLSEEECNTAFWYGFHPKDREVLRPCLLSKNPFQLPDAPFHFEDVFSCARAAFAYDDYFLSPWSHAKQFQYPSVRREQPVVEPSPRDAYSFRAVTCTIASNTETTPDELSPSSHSMPDSDLPHSLISPSESLYTQAPSLPSSSSPSVLESQHGLVHSVTVDQPEPAYTLSATFPPSDSPPSHTSTLVLSATDNDLIPTPPFSSTFLLSPVSMRSAVNSQPELEPALASECLIPPSLDHVPEIASTPPSSSASLTNLESVPSAMVDQPESEPEYVSLSSITPTHSLPSPSLTLEFTDDVRELLSLPPTPLSGSLARSEDSTSLSSPTKPPPPETLTSMPAHSLPSLHLSPGELCCNPVLKPFSTPASSYHPELSLLSLVTPTLIPHLPLASPSSTLSRSGLTYFNFVFALISTAVLVLTLLNISKTFSTFVCKVQDKRQDIGNSQTWFGSPNIFTQQLQLGQLMPCAPCLVFDPGGPASSSSLKILSAHEDVCKRKSKTRDGIISRSTPASPFPFQQAISSFSIPGGVGFATRRRLQAQAPVI
ncbi:hypothetical protein EDB85DRAFT_2288079 [Lactarius pseudohatsudake]|nr:hypothetical protein EDB85DRAFT_2288079 [Lactarius pseudohatsudake]